MAPTLRIKTFLLLSLLLLAPLSSSGLVEGFKEGMNPHNSFVKDGIHMINTRKLLLDTLDYDDAGPNRRHDPRGKLLLVVARALDSSRTINSPSRGFVRA